MKRIIINIYLSVYIFGGKSMGLNVICAGGGGGDPTPFRQACKFQNISSDKYNNSLLISYVNKIMLVVGFYLFLNEEPRNWWFIHELKRIETNL